MTYTLTVASWRDFRRLLISICDCGQRMICFYVRPNFSRRRDNGPGRCMKEVLDKGALSRLSKERDTFLVAVTCYEDPHLSGIHSPLLPPLPPPFVEPHNFLLMFMSKPHHLSSSLHRLVRRPHIYHSSLESYSDTPLRLTLKMDIEKAVRFSNDVTVKNIERSVVAPETL